MAASKAPKTSVNGKQVKTLPVPETDVYNKRKLSRSKLPPIYKCAMCGNVYAVGDGIFYKSANSIFAKNNDGYAIVCIKCVTDYFDKMREELHDEKVALMCTCMVLGCHFAPDLYESMRERKALKLGDYLKALNGIQYKGKNFSNFLIDLSKTMEFMRSDNEFVTKNTRWKDTERQNRDYVMSVLGYDPFTDNCYKDSDRRFLFNTLSEYLTDDVVEDGHKIQACIQMAINYLQVNELNQLISREFNASSGLNNTNLSGYVNNKRQILDSINKIAADNGISAKGAGKTSRATLAITSIMKEMLNAGYDTVKANYVDAKMSSVYQNISKTNIAAIMKELDLTSDDYAKMVSDQAGKIQEAQKETEKLKEENRQLKIAFMNQQKELKALTDGGSKK